MPVYKVPKAEEKDYIELSTAFIDKYMPKASGQFVKVYLLGLRQCFTSNPIDIVKDIAKILDMTQAEVTAAWFYWQQERVVSLPALKGGGGFDVEFEVIDSKNKKEEVIYTKTRPVYTGSDIKKGVQDNKLLHDLFESAQQILGKPLSTPETSTLYSFYDWLKLPIEVILLLINHCVGMDKKGMAYIEAVAIEWHRKGINTHDKAEEYLRQIERNYSEIGKIQKKLGISGRQITDSEKKYINKWMKDMSLTIEVIAYAGEITVANTGKVSFAYMDKMLQDWHQKGVKTAKQAEMVRQATKPATRNSGTSPVKQNKGVSTFTGKPIDFDAIDKKANELLYRKKKTGVE